jgi:hypothetical protein
MCVTGTKSFYPPEMFRIVKGISFVMGHDHTDSPEHHIKHQRVHQQKEDGVSEDLFFDALHLINIQKVLNGDLTT